MKYPMPIFRHLKFILLLLGVFGMALTYTRDLPPVQRNFQAFLPKPDENADEPASQLVQILLDRQEKDGFESYMIQVLFRGHPAERHIQRLKDRILVDFYDTGKPAMRLVKIRGGIVEASALEELFYKVMPDSQAKAGGVPPPQVKKMVRLTLFMHAKIQDLKIRDTLDRTLIHFRLPLASNP